MLFHNQIFATNWLQFFLQCCFQIHNCQLFALVEIGLGWLYQVLTGEHSQWSCWFFGLSIGQNDLYVVHSTSLSVRFQMSGGMTHRFAGCCVGWVLRMPNFWSHEHSFSTKDGSLGGWGHTQTCDDNFFVVEKFVDIGTGFNCWKYTNGGYSIIVFNFGTHACNEKDSFMWSYKGVGCISWKLCWKCPRHVQFMFSGQAHVRNSQGQNEIARHSLCIICFFMCLKNILTSSCMSSVPPIT